MEQEKDKIHDGESSRPFQFVCRLVSVDVSGCKLTSTAIRHLATLTGPTLRDVDISCSKVEFAVLRKKEEIFYLTTHSTLYLRLYGVRPW